jgi:hypothetical protein
MAQALGHAGTIRRSDDQVGWRSTLLITLAACTINFGAMAIAREGASLGLCVAPPI